MPSDPLTHVLSALELDGAATARLEAAGEWALRFPAKPHLKFNAVLRGRCWIRLPGRMPLHLAAGDTFLLSDAPPFVLSSRPDGLPDSALLTRPAAGLLRHGGDDTVLVGGGFRFGASAALLVAALPDFMLIPASDPASAVLCGTLQLLADELGADRMGSELLTRRLADVLLVQALRAHVAASGPERTGWLGALADRRIGAALRAIHAAPGRAWTVADLAAEAAMSRSGFALRFHTLVGQPPLGYLGTWRMQLARAGLARGETVRALAARLGYRSDSAFGHAFKRAHGAGPRRFRGAAGPAPMRSAFHPAGDGAASPAVDGFTEAVREPAPGVAPERGR